MRPEIAIDFHGYKFVAVGSRLYYSKTWKFFPDFLTDYVPTVFGKELGEAELAKPFEGRHQVVQWRQRCIEFLRKQRPNADGFYAAIPNGFAAAYFSFAYDLYVVEHNARLDEDLLTRLKHSDQFQGARHELFAEATCLRAGFEIRHEDERNRSARHAEFTATHESTGQLISVEAKSKHRPGVLGRPGVPESVEDVSLRFGRLLNDAIDKKPPHPLVIFLDTNLPPDAADPLFRIEEGKPPQLAVKLVQVLDRVRKEEGGVDPYVLLVVTNHPHHYGREGEVDPRKSLVSMLSQVPKTPPTSTGAIMAIHQAAQLYGNVPNEFPDPRD